MWPKTIKFINYWSGLQKSKQPGQGKPCQNVSYNALIKAVKDPLVPVKVQFINEITRTVNSFFILFQLNRPTAPFLVDNIENWAKESKSMFAVD